MAIGTLSTLIDNALTKIRSRYQLVAMDSHAEKVTKSDAIYNFRNYLEEVLAIFERHPGISQSGWFKSLKMRLVGTYASRERVGLTMREPIKTPTLTDYGTEVQKQIQPVFERLQSMQQGLLQYSRDYPSPDSEEVFDWRFPPSYLSQKHPSVIFLSSPFYQYALCRTNPEYLPKDADHNLALRAANLLNSDLSNKGIRRKKIIAALSLLIPDNDGYCWATDEKTPPEHQAKFSLVYWRKADHYPAIIVELSDHMDSQPRSLARSEALYALSLEKFQHIQKECGAPALFLDFFNSRMSFAGAVCDSPFGMCTYQILPGTVDLRPNWPGCCGNRQDTVLSLLSLKKCVRALMELLGSCKGQVGQKFNTGTPAIGLDSSGITITEVIKHGILFKVKLDFRTDNHKIAQSLEAGRPGFSPDAAYVLKTIYGRRNTRYGTSVHKRLAAARFAPAFHCEFAPVDGMNLFGEGKKPDPLIRYCIFDYLPLPSIELPGWITLANLTFWPDIARQFKPLIHSTLLHILSLLEQANMVHGDFRPNNILIKVEVGIGIGEAHSPLPLHREDHKDLLDIMVVDFDWSGKAGEVCYPYARNDRVLYWPGRDAGPIGPNDDRKMVEAWMKLWPETFGVESVPAVYDWL